MRGYEVILFTHLSCALCADVILVLAGIIATLYLIQDHVLRHKSTLRVGFQIPPISTLDRIGLQLLLAGFVCMTIGMVSGGVLARHFWGPRWFMDPRQLWSIATWLSLAVLLLLRGAIGWRGRRASQTVLATVLFLLIGLWGVNWLQNSKHNTTHAGATLP